VNAVGICEHVRRLAIELHGLWEELRIAIPIRLLSQSNGLDDTLVEAGVVGFPLGTQDAAEDGVGSQSTARGSLAVCGVHGDRLARDFFRLIQASELQKEVRLPSKRARRERVASGEFIVESKRGISVELIEQLVRVIVLHIENKASRAESGSPGPACRFLQRPMRRRIPTAPAERQAIPVLFAT